MEAKILITYPLCSTSIGHSKSYVWLMDCYEGFTTSYAWVKYIIRRSYVFHTLDLLTPAFDYYVGLINSYVGQTKSCVELTYLIRRTETVQIVTMTLAGQFEETSTGEHSNICTGTMMAKLWSLYKYRTGTKILYTLSNTELIRLGHTRMHVITHVNTHMCTLGYIRLL